MPPPPKGRGTSKGGIVPGRGCRALSRSAIQIEARQLTLVYAARRHEDKDDVDVITCTFIYCLPYFTLIDIGFTHSYISRIVSMKLNITAECTAGLISVVSLLGQSIRVEKVFKRVSLEIMFSTDLMELSFGEIMFPTNL